MSIITWLHISDLHFRAPKAGTREQKRKIQALLTDVGQIRAGKRTFSSLDLKNNPIDFILLTGDIAASGTREEYLVAARFIGQLTAAIDVPPSRVLAVPGNHDVRREFHKLNDRSVYDSLKLAPNPDELRKALDAAGLRDSQSSKRTDAAKNLVKKLSMFTEFQAGFSSDLHNEPAVRTVASGARLWTWPIDGQLVEIVGFDTAWACGADDHDLSPIVGQHQREDIAELFNPSASLRLVLQHHPTDTLISADRYEHEKWLASHHAICLAGHVHNHWHRTIGLAEGTFVEIVGGSASYSYSGDHRYSFGQCRFGDANPYLRVAPRQLRGDNYHLDPTFGADAEGGVYDFGSSLTLPFAMKTVTPERGNDRPGPPLEVERDDNRVTYQRRRYMIESRKVFRDIKQHVNFPIRVYADKFPDDRAKSLKLYARSPLTLNGIELEVEVDGRKVDPEVVLDTPSLKELTVPLGPSARELVYRYTIPQSLWGSFFQREIRFPTDHFSVELVFDRIGRAGDVHAAQRPLASKSASPLRAHSVPDGPQEKFNWELTDVEPNTRFAVSWNLST